MIVRRLGVPALVLGLVACGAPPAEEVTTSSELASTVDLCHGRQEDRVLPNGGSVGGIPVVGPSATVFVGLGGRVRLARGTLAAAFPIAGVLLPAGTKLDGDCRGEAFEATVPSDVTLAGATFSASQPITVARRDASTWNDATYGSITGTLAAPLRAQIYLGEHTLPVSTKVAIHCYEALCLADSPGQLRTITLAAPLSVALGDADNTPETYALNAGDHLVLDDYGYVTSAVGAFNVDGAAAGQLGFCRYPQYVRSMQLSAPATIAGYSFAAWEHASFYCAPAGQRQLKSAPKALPNTSVGGFSITEGQLVSFYRDGAVRSGTLANATTIAGKTLPAGTFGCFDSDGHLREGLVPPFGSSTHKFIFSPTGAFVEERTYDPEGCGGTIAGFADTAGE